MAEVFHVVIDPRGAKSGSAEVKRSFQTVGSSASSTTATIAKFGAAVGVAFSARAVVAFAAESTRAALDFGKAMAEVSTLLPDTDDLAEVARQVRDLSVEFNQSPVDQAKALYQVISAGARDAAEAQEILTVANRLAVGGVTDVETAADGLTSVLNAYGLEASAAGEVSDALFVAMKAGKTTIGELSGSLGKVAPLAAQVGINIEELAAATAALTKGGITTRESITGLRAIMAAVVKPTEEARLEAERLEIQFNSTALETQGLAGFMDTLVEASGGSTDSLALLFGGVEALVPALALAGQAGDDFNDILIEMDEKAGATGEAFSKIAESDAFRLEKALGELKDVTIDLGNAILIGLVPAMELAAENIENFGESARLAFAIITGDGASMIEALRDLADVDKKAAAEAKVFTDALQDQHDAAVQIPPDMEKVATSIDDVVTSSREAVETALTPWEEFLAILKEIREEAEKLERTNLKDTLSGGGGIISPTGPGGFSGPLNLGLMIPTMNALNVSAGDTVETLGGLNDVMGLLDSESRQAVRGLSDVAGGIESLVAGGLSAGGIGLIAGGLAGIIGGLFGGNGSAEREAERQANSEAALRQFQATERFDAAVKRFSEAVGGTPNSLAETLIELTAQLRKDSGFLPTAGDPLDPKFIELLDEYLRKVGEVTAAFNEELDIRSLLAQGLDEEADQRRFEIAQRQELSDAVAAGFDKETVDRLEYIQGIEAVARAEAAAAEELRQSAAFDEDVVRRRLQVEGTTREILIAGLEARSAAEKEAAQELVAAGIITVAQFNALADVIGVEMVAAIEAFDVAAEQFRQSFQDDLDARRRALTFDGSELLIANLKAVQDAEWEAAQVLFAAGQITIGQLNDLADILGNEFSDALISVAEAAAASAEALRVSILLASEDLGVRALLAAGMIKEAEIRAFQLKQQREFERFDEAGFGVAFLLELANVQAAEFSNFLKDVEDRFAPPETPADDLATAEQRSVAGFNTGGGNASVSSSGASEVSTQRLSAINLSQLAVLQEIAANTRGLRGGGANINEALGQSTIEQGAQAGRVGL